MSETRQKIAFQGSFGAYSDSAARQVFPDSETLPCLSFEEAFAAIREGKAQYAMIPIDNSTAGRVADIHHLLPDSGAYIVGEHFQRVHHCLLGVPGADIGQLREVHSHIHALGQCRAFIRELGITPIVHADTAGAAQDIAKRGDPHIAAIASPLAGKLYGLSVLRENIEDAEHNITRFIIMAKESKEPKPEDGPAITSLIFRARNIPAALYKAIGGFATNGVNISKLESYVGDRFTVAQFYLDIEGHPQSEPVRLALEELDFFSQEMAMLGVYPAHPYRQTYEC